jgi:hypothetical protein
MGFVERELDRLELALKKPQTGEHLIQVMAARDALKWATEPQANTAPLDIIDASGVRLPAIELGTPSGTADYQGASHLAPS